MKKHNFFAGPSILPAYTVEKTSEAILNLNGIGLSLMEISHRSKDFQAVMDEAVALFKELLNIPEGYSVIFVGGGASLQFAMVPYNMLETKAAYLNTGEWATKAIKEAKMFGEVQVVASSEDKLFNYIPRGFEVPKDADYFHVTSNNTIYGTELFEDFDFGVPLVADMSSDILSRPVDVSKYAMIYGGAQKNLAPAGVTFVIIRNDILGKADRKIPTMLNYKTHEAICLFEDALQLAGEIHSLQQKREAHKMLAPLRRRIQGFPVQRHADVECRCADCLHAGI